MKAVVVVFVLVSVLFWIATWEAPPPSEDLEVSQIEDRDFLIRVVDEAGVPMDHALVVIIDPDQEKIPNMAFDYFQARNFRQGITGEDGSFAVRVAANQGDKLFYARRLRFLCLRFGGEPLDVTVDLNPSTSEIKLVMPPTLRLHLKVEDQGRAIEETARVVWVAGDRSPNLGGNTRIHRREPLSKNILDYLVKWEMPVPPAGIVLRAFAPGVKIAMAIQVPHCENAKQVIALPKCDEHQAVLQVGKRKVRLLLSVVDENGDDAQALLENSKAGWSVELSQEHDEETIARMKKVRESLMKRGRPFRVPLRTRIFRGRKLLPTGKRPLRSCSNDVGRDIASLRWYGPGAEGKKTPHTFPEMWGCIAATATKCATSGSIFPCSSEGGLTNGAAPGENTV